MSASDWSLAPQTRRRSIFRCEISTGMPASLPTFTASVMASISWMPSSRMWLV